MRGNLRLQRPVAADCTDLPYQLAQVYGFTDLDGSRPDAWRYVREVQDAGKPADATGYR